MAKAPAFQFYTGDWKKDPELSLCSPATRGIWIDLLCAMHDRDRSGTITGTIAQLSRLCRCTEAEMKSAIDDLNATNAADVTECNGIVTVISRRMQNEAIERLKTHERVKKHRGNGDVTELKRESNVSSSSSSSSSTAFKKELPSVVPKKADTEEAKPVKKPPSRGSRIPDDFRVTDAMSRWAAAETPGVSIAFETKQFTDYYRAAPNSKGIKLDWTATWRTWMRNAYTGFGDRVKKPVDTFPKHIPDEADKPFDCLNCADDGFTIGSYNKTLDTWPKIPCPKCERGKTWKPEADPDTG